MRGRTRREVGDKIRAATIARDSGSLVVIQAGQSTVAEWMTFWLESIASAKVRPSTLHTYGGYVRNRINPALGRHRLDKLQPEHLEAFYRASLDEGLAPATVLQMHRILSRALKVAMRRGRAPRNVATLVDAPTVHRTEVVPLTATEAKRVLTAASSERNAARWSVALALGLRQGEALGLTWEDLDLAAGTVTIRRALQRRPGGGLVFVQPKSHAGRRTIVIPLPLVSALRRQLQAQRIERLSAGQLWTDAGVVFASPIGKPIDPRADHRSWQLLLDRAGVRRARLHDARHTAATLLLAQGVPARVAMQILGHSQIGLTLGTYSHVIPELAHDAAARMAEALWDDPEIPNSNGLAATLAARADSRGDDPKIISPVTWANAVRRQGLEPRTRGLRVRCS
ncbi:MAG: site-specific integrase, partial [Actinomycetota bacterium]